MIYDYDYDFIVNYAILSLDNLFIFYYFKFL